MPILNYYSDTFQWKRCNSFSEMILQYITRNMTKNSSYHVTDVVRKFNKKVGNSFSIILCVKQYENDPLENEIYEIKFLIL